MSWGLGWKRASEIFHLSLDYGDPVSNESHANAATPPSSPSSAGDLGFRIDLDWSGYDDEDQVALRLQSKLMVALPPPVDTVFLDLEEDEKGDEGEERVRVSMRILKRREPLRAVRLTKAIGSGQQIDGIGVLKRLLNSNTVPVEHWQSVTVLSICNCGLTVSSLD